MKVVLLFVSVMSAAVINRDTDYYEYDPIERVYTTDDIELGPVDAKAMMSSDTVRVPVGQLRSLLNLAMREYKRHDRSRSYMKQRRLNSSYYRRAISPIYVPSGKPYRRLNGDY